MIENVGQAAVGPGDVGLLCAITASTQDGRHDVELLEVLLPAARQTVKGLQCDSEILVTCNQFLSYNLC